MIIVNKFVGGVTLLSRTERRAGVGSTRLSSVRLPKGGLRCKEEVTPRG